MTLTFDHLTFNSNKFASRVGVLHISSEFLIGIYIKGGALTFRVSVFVV